MRYSSFFIVITVFTGVLTLNPDYKIDVLTLDTGLLLKSPQWSVEENVFYWSDLLTQSVYRLNPENGKITTMTISGSRPVTLVVPVKGFPGIQLVGLGAALYLVNTQEHVEDSCIVPKLLTFVDTDKPDNSIEDSTIDAKGRLWFGTIGAIGEKGFDILNVGGGSLYFMDATNYNMPTVKISSLSISNGVSFSPDNKKMYHCDSLTRKVDVYDFELENGEIGNKTVFFDFDIYNVSGIPDGTTVDSDGNVYIATFHGRSIIIVDPTTGTLLDKIRLPVDQVTSMAWGGQDLSTLYVTTGKFRVASPLPYSGSLLAITNTGSRGVPQSLFEFPDAKKILNE